MSDYMDDSDESGEGPPIKSGSVIIDDPDGNGKYVLKMKLMDGYEYEAANRVSATLHFVGPSIDKKELVGYLRGNLLPRPCQIFFGMADAISGELQGLACLFCESDGKATRIQHPDLQPQEDDSPTLASAKRRAVGSGGFLHIETVEVRKQHKGKDLALHMIHHLFGFLGDLWTLAVMELAGLNYHALKWTDNERIEIGLVDRHADGEPSAERKEKMKRKTIAVQRHFARMGFRQAGRSSGVCDCWFLSKPTYLGEGNENDSIARWITKERAQNEIDVFYPPEKPPLKALDKDLKETTMQLIRSGQTSGTAMSILEGIVNRGASIDASCVMHFAAANAKGTDVAILRELVRLGGDVNAADHDGNRPLHVAAFSKNVPALQYLLSCGADRTAMNSDGSTPLVSFQKSVRNGEDFDKTFGIGHILKEIDIVPQLETAKALMSHEQRNVLIDGWMSPRMHECLLITAELDADAMTEGGYAYDPDPIYTPNKPTPLREVCQSYGFRRIEYIPMRVLKSDPNGIYKSFFDAWGLIFNAINRVLERRQAPTVTRIKMEINNNGQLYDLRKVQHYENRGGKVEYALDAVLKATENVVKNGDDGWEYSTFEEKIEALPATPLDKMFDVARFMCFNRGGGELDQPGPHRDVWVYGLEEDEDSD